MKKNKRIIVTIVALGVTDTHMFDPRNSYETLCGMDGNDDSSDVDQRIVPTTVNKITCRHCIDIWDACKAYSEKDIQREVNE